MGNWGYVDLFRPTYRRPVAARDDYSFFFRGKLDVPRSQRTPMGNPQRIVLYHVWVFMGYDFNPQEFLDKVVVSIFFNFHPEP